MGEVVLVFSVSTLILFFLIGWKYARDNGLARSRPSLHAYVKGKIGHTKTWAVLAFCRKWINLGPVLLARSVLRALRVNSELLCYIKGKIRHTKTWTVLAFCRKWINLGPVLLARSVLRALRVYSELLWDVLFIIAATVSDVRTVASRRKRFQSSLPRAEPHSIPHER